VVRQYLATSAAPAEKRNLLCHPTLIEGLHGLATASPTVGRWHATVAAASADTLDPQAVPAALGNVTLSLLLKRDRNWQGECHLVTDVIGRVAFPFSDWTVGLRDREGECLGGQVITVALSRDRASWCLGSSPFLVTSRADCLRLVVDNDDPCDLGATAFPDQQVRPRLQRAVPLGHSSVRYDPVGFRDDRGHAGTTGGLVQRLLASIRINSPAVYREMVTYLHVIRGFEFPRAAGVASFSDPTLPGVMGFSVAYTDDDEPCLNPFCFTWFGHEMGHTKDYLCESALHARAATLIRNPTDRTAPIPRYGRPLSVRSVVQVPYVHLYEWALFMDFWQAGFATLPWSVLGDAIAVGEDLEAEIAEAFALIREVAHLTPIGEVAVSYFQELFDQMRVRWRSLRSRGYPRVS
jgi:hypothetical protein